MKCIRGGEVEIKLWATLRGAQLSFNPKEQPRLWVENEHGMLGNKMACWIWMEADRVDW